MKLSKYVDCFLGKNILIANSNIAKVILYYKELFDKEIQSDLINALEMSYKFDVYIMNIYHPKYKQIAKLMHNSWREHGIIVKIDRLVKHGWLLYDYLIEKFADQEMLKELKQLIHANYAIFEKFFGVFVLFLFMLSICTIVFIIKCLFCFINLKIN